MISLEFVLNRATASRATAGVLAQPPTSFIWALKTQQEWTDDLVSLDQLGTSEVIARTLWRNAAEAWRGSLNQIQYITRLTATLGEVRFRADAVLVKSFRRLKTDGRSRPALYDQGKAALAAWQAADPTWIVKDDFSEFSSGAFGSLIAAADAQGTTHAGKLAAWRKGATGVMSKARALDRDNIDWYKEVTKKFKKGTTAGDLIRSSVPTTYTPVPPVGQAVITELMVSGTDLHLDVAAPHASKFTYLQQAPGAAAFVVVVIDSPLSHLTLHNQAPGLHRFKVIGRNSTGEGPESVIAEVTVAQQQAA